MPSIISSALSFFTRLLSLLLLLMNRELLSSSASTCATNSRFFSVNSSNTFCRSAKSRAEFALRNVRGNANAKRKREDTHKDNVSAVKKIKTHSNAYSNDGKREKWREESKESKETSSTAPRSPHRQAILQLLQSVFKAFQLSRKDIFASDFFLHGRRAAATAPRRRRAATLFERLRGFLTARERVSRRQVMVLPSTDDLIFRRTVFVVFAVVVPGRCRRAKTVRGHRERESVSFRHECVCARACSFARYRPISLRELFLFSRVRFNAALSRGKKAPRNPLFARDTTQNSRRDKW